MSCEVRAGYRVLLGEDYKDYVDTTYESFLALARSMCPPSKLLTDNEDVVQLQNLYFLLRRGVLKVTEEKSQDGRASLFLEIAT